MAKDLAGWQEDLAGLIYPIVGAADTTKVGKGILDGVDGILGFAKDPAGPVKSLLQWLYKQLDAWDKEGEKFFLGGLRKLLTDSWNVPVAAADRIVSTMEMLSPDTPPLRTFTAVTAGLANIAAAMLKTSTASSVEFTKSINRILLPEMLGPGEILQAIWRGHDGEARFGDIGLGGDWLTAFKLASEARPNFEQVQELRRRGFIIGKEYADALQALGYKPTREYDKRDLFDELRELILDRGTLDEKLRRDTGFADKWKAGMLKVGYKEADLETLKATVDRLPSYAIINELHRRGLLKPDEARGELNRLGFAPPVGDVLADLRWNVIDPRTLINLQWRGKIPQDELTERMIHAGWNIGDAGLLEEAEKFQPPPADVIRFGVREVFTPEVTKLFGQFLEYPKDLTPWGTKIGISEEIMRLYWAAHWDLPSPGQGFDMYHRGIIDRSQLAMLLRALDVMPWWRGRIIKLSERLIPRRTLPRLARNGLIDEAGLVDRFFALGYSREDSIIMAKDALIEDAAAWKDLTKSELVDSYAHELIDKEELDKLLKRLDYKDYAREYYFWKAERKRVQLNATADAESQRDESTKARELTKGELLKGYREGLLTYDDTSASLAVLEYTPETVVYLLASEDYRRQREMRNAAAARVKDLFDAKVITATEAEKELVTAGLLQPEARRRIEVWAADLSVRDLLAAAAPRQPSRADAEKWLKINVIDVDQWVEYMYAFGYGDREIQRYLSEIAIEMGVL